MSREVELTLQELAQIALGTGTQLNSININVLHSLVNILLKKLNIQDEKVSFVGIESQCLKEALKRSKTTQLSVVDNKIQTVTTKLNQLGDLEERVQKLDEKLEMHFEQIRLCNKAEDKSNQFDFWEKYSGPCEDLCVTCDPENKIACDLIKNQDFVKKLQRRLAAPIVERIFQLEDKIVRLNNDFNEFLKRAKEEYTRIELIGRCIHELEKIRKQVDDNHLEFLGTMEEVQDMLDAKLDKIHLPALKKYLKDRFDEIEGKINKLQSVKGCPKASGVIMGDIKCLSCGNVKVCADVTTPSTSLLADMPKRKKFKSPRFCGCSTLHNAVPELKLHDRMLRLNIKTIAQTKAKSESNRSCNFCDDHMQFIVGSDGAFYRRERSSMN